ncbi:hypothetical protein NQZ68_001520 [Dissostichus eleginoides]|nr:hypothetical protein NQZ68_001520 [Dissostichus eleginoides]
MSQPVNLQRDTQCSAELSLDSTAPVITSTLQGGEAADSTFSSLYPSSSIPPSPSVLFTLCRPAAVPPQRHSRPPRSWRTLGIDQGTALTMGTTGGDGGGVVLTVAWWWGSFYAVDRAGG